MITMAFLMSGSEGFNEIGRRAGSRLIPRSEVFRRASLLGSGPGRRTVVVWVAGLHQVRAALRLFAESVQFCQQVVEVGVWKPEDSFVFIAESQAVREEVCSTQCVSSQDGPERRCRCCWTR